MANTKQPKQLPHNLKFQTFQIPQNFKINLKSFNSLLAKAFVSSRKNPFTSRQSSESAFHDSQVNTHNCFRDFEQEHIQKHTNFQKATKQIS
jgi:hypothetical protein